MPRPRKRKHTTEEENPTEQEPIEEDPTEQEPIEEDPTEQEPIEEDPTEELLDSSEEEDAGSGFESVFTDDEEMFFHGKDPAQDDPKLAGSNTPQKSKRWKDVDEEDVEPSSFLFRPARNPGALLNCTEDYSPLDLFHLFFSIETILNMVNNTNKHAQVRKDTGKKYKWEPVEMIEFVRFCGLHIFMGIVRCPKIHDYWQTSSMWQTPFVRRIMTRNRFQAISWSLHISDPESDSKNYAKKGTPDYDNLAKIRPLMESMKTACKSFYHPRQNLSIDERMVPTKAKNGLKMYIKAKPHKWGYKLFALCDSSNGYTCDFNIYTGQSPNKTSNGLSYDSVMSLIDPHFLGTGYTLYCANYYTSPTLFRDLHKMKITACGTVRDNRTGFPTAQENSLTKTSERGTMKWIRQGPLLFVKWADVREVSICSTAHKAYSGDVVSRRQRQHDGTWENCTMPIPAPIKAYNKHMGGVDLSDQRLQNYTTCRKTYRWYKTFFFHFLDMAVLNAYLLHKEQCITKSQKHMTHLNFRKKLCEELCDIKTVKLTNNYFTDVSPNHEFRRLPRGPRRCRQCKAEGKRSDSSWMCAQCDVPLCASAVKNCFRKWHLSSPPSKKVKQVKKEEEETDCPITGDEETSASVECVIAHSFSLKGIV